MTKEEYEDFVLRYKGCGACFPLYVTLTRFEKKWFSAIQKDVAELEKENAELKEQLNFKTRFVKGEKAINQLAQAIEIIKTLVNDLSMYSGSYQKELSEAEQFLNDIKE